MSGYQYNNGLYSSGSQHYSHPYAPNGEPSQPLRSTYGLPQLGTNGVENGPTHYQPPYQPPPTPPPQSTTPPFYTEARRSQSDLAPIPAPVIKSDYAAPVFQTFQERKRAKEQARTQSVGYSPIRASQDHPAATPPPSSSRDMLPPVLPCPAPPSPSKSAPLPPIRPSSSRPLPSPIRTHTAPPEAGPSSPRTPVESLERSDTISSVKSLDRGMGFSSPSKRPLPKPPVVVVASKSLDRGMPSGIGAPPVVRAAAPLPRAGDGYEKKTGRRLPSTVTEMSEGSEGDLSGEMGRMSLSRSNSPVKQSPVKPRVALPSPSIPTINVPSIVEPPPSIDEPSTPRIMKPPRIVEPSIPRIMGPPMIVEPPMIIEPPTIVEPGSRPATFQPLPSISIGDDEPEIVFAGLPTIAVSTFDAPAKITSQPTATRIDPTSAILCTGCTNPIIGRIVSAMGQRWHPQCFMCGECGELLEHVSSYEYNGRPYCHLDYHDKFAHRCHHCKTPIVEPRFITLDDPVLGQRFYHELHFFCSECGDPFLDPSRSSAPGTERTRSSQPEEEETNAFVIQKGHPYCERCHLRLHKPKCKGCKLPIPDLAVDAMGAKWHQDCFVCEECGNGFANSLFFPQDGKAFCTECYGVMVGH